MARLPQPGSDDGVWGDILNDYLSQSLTANGSIKPNAVNAAALAPGAVDTASILDSQISEVKLTSAVQTKLNQTAPVQSVAGKTGAVTLTNADVGLGNVDNTSDTGKPVSTAQQTALDLKLNTADLDSQTATKITTSGTQTHVALSTAYIGMSKGIQRFVEKLNSGVTAVVALAGDSTSDEGPEWFKRTFTDLLATRLWITGNYKLWNDGTQSNDASVMQTGAASTVLPLRISWDNFSRTASELVASQAIRQSSQWAGQTGIWSIDGTSAVAVGSNQFSGPNLPGLATIGTKRQLVANLTLDTTTATKTIQFWLGKTGSNRVCVNIASNAGTNTWKLYKQIAGVGADVTASAAVTLPSGAAVTNSVTLTLDGTTLSATMNGQTITGTLTGGDVAALSDGTNIYLNMWGAVAGNVTGTKINDIYMDVWADRSVTTLEIYNGSRTGSILTYQQTRIVTMYPVEPDALFVSSSHNYTSTNGTDYITAVEAFLDAYRAVYPNSFIVLSSQNPEVAPVSQANRDAHRARMMALRAQAVLKGYGYIAAYEAFEANWTPVRVRNDGFHPTAASSFDALSDPDNGQYLWKNATLAYLASAGVS